MDNYLQVGIDFSQKGADFCLLFSDDRVLDMHQHFANSQSGYEQVRYYLLQALQQHAFDSLHVSGEFTIPDLGLILAVSITTEIGGLDRFFTSQKWYRRHKRWRSRDLRDVEDSVAKMG